MLCFPKTPENSRYCVSFQWKVWKQTPYPFISRIHYWLGTSMALDLLRDLAVNVVYGHTILILKRDICNAYMSIHPRRMMTSSLFIDI